MMSRAAPRPNEPEPQTLEQLRTENFLLRAALAPFASAFRAEWHRDRDPDTQAFLDRNEVTPSMTVGDFRRAYEIMMPERDKVFRD